MDILERTERQLQYYCFLEYSRTHVLREKRKRRDTCHNINK